MAFGAGRNIPFCDGDSIREVDLEHQIFSARAFYSQQAIRSLTSPHHTEMALPANVILPNTCRQTCSSAETNSDNEDDHFVNALVEQMACAMLDEESETEDESSKPYDTASWENLSYNACEEGVPHFQERWLHSLNCKENESNVNNSWGDEGSYQPDHTWLNNVRLPFVDNQISLPNVKAFYDLNARLFERAWIDQMERESPEQVFLRNQRAILMSRDPLQMKSSECDPHSRRRQHPEETFVHPSFWNPLKHGFNYTEKLLQQSSSFRCNQTNKYDPQQTKPNIKACYSQVQPGHHEILNTAHCRYNHISDGGIIPPRVFLGRTGAVRESVGTGVFLPRSRTRTNNSKRKSGRMQSKSVHILDSQSIQSLKYNSTEEMDLKYQSKKFPANHLQPPMESRLPTEWTY